MEIPGFVYTVIGIYRVTYVYIYIVRCGCSHAITRARRGKRIDVPVLSHNTIFAPPNPIILIIIIIPSRYDVHRIVKSLEHRSPDIVLS